MSPTGDGWYSYIIEDASSASIMFTYDGKMTTDFVQNAGEFWYMNNQWYDKNPSAGDVTPLPTATPTPEPTIGVDVTVAPTGGADITEIPIPTGAAGATITPSPVITPGDDITVTPEPTAEPIVTLEATATPGPTATPTPTKVPVTGKMVLHVKTDWSNVNVYYWAVNGNESDKPVEWPGTPMTSEGNSWYTYTIEDATSAKVIFNNGSAQTDDLSQIEGEWWYQDGKWTSNDPTVPTASPTPTLSPTPRPTNTPTPTRDPNASPTPTPQPMEHNDFRDETIYFVMTARFYDGDSTNNFHSDHDAEVGNGDDDPAWRGDFKGLIEKLDYIKALGFTAIWITPVAENASGYDFHGYHAINFNKVDPRLESSGATYQDLINEAHKRGIKIIQDVVLNHTGNSGEETLFPIMDRTYTLGQGVTGNSYTMTPKQSALDSLNQFMGIVSGGTFSNYNDALSDKQNGSTWQYKARDQWMKSGDLIYRKKVDIGWEDFTVTTGQFAGDCMELNTELPTVYNYLTDAYSKYIDMGVDAFRIDTVKHISRLTMNEVFIPAFKKAAAENGNEYHEPDYSQSSGMGVIDYSMHFNFQTANKAFNAAKAEDEYMNDSSYNVVYVDSHDYGPGIDGRNDQDGNDLWRYEGGTDAWAENLNLMFTFRGIPCVYYGSEVEFMKGARIDNYVKALSQTGRAYYGDYLEGTVTATDFSEYTASGPVADTLSKPLAQHIQRLNKIRAAIPALRRGQYSLEGVSGDMAFKRRYTNKEEGIDSFVCVSITNGATFTGVPNGTYVDAITGTSKTVTNGTLTIEATNQGNMRVYVLDGLATAAPGKVGTNGTYLK